MSDWVIFFGLMWAMFMVWGYFDSVRVVRLQRKEREAADAAVIPNLEKTIAYSKEHNLDASDYEDQLREAKERENRKT